MTRPIQLFVTGALLLSLLASHGRVNGDEKLAGIACRSVHLNYPAADGLAFYNEVTVEHSAVGTYFCVCGFNFGYYGMQELGNGKKLLIFSVWDPGSQDDPKNVDEEKRVKLLHQDKDVRVGRFGGEGTGGQSFFDYEWSIGKTYRFLLEAKLNGERTEYTASFFVPETNAWKQLVTFSTITGGKPLKGYYSFIEDFKRDRVSATKAREARFGNGWVRSMDGQWIALTRAQFTADSNPATNINAVSDSARFFLATGGDTKNTGAQLKGFLNREPAGLALPGSDSRRISRPRVVHFEIHAEKPERAARFYTDLFGWRFDKWSGPKPYWVITTGTDGTPGINGGMIERAGLSNNAGPIDGTAVIAYVCTVEVASVDDSTAKVSQLGGTVVVPKMPIPGIGWLVYVKDTEGNIFGMTEPDTGAK